MWHRTISLPRLEIKPEALRAVSTLKPGSHHEVLRKKNDEDDHGEWG